jgi:hypothetical protein
MNKENDMSASREKNVEIIVNTAREALVGTGLALMALGFMPQDGDQPKSRYVVPFPDSDCYEFVVGMKMEMGDSSPDPICRVTITSRRFIPMEAAYGGGDAQLIAATNRACMEARVQIHAALRDAAERVDPTRK